MRRLASLVLLTAVGACAPAAPDYRAVFDGTGGQWVDLTHAFSESTIYWPTDTAGFQLDELAFGPTEGGWFLCVLSVRFGRAWRHPPRCADSLCRRTIDGPTRFRCRH